MIYDGNWTEKITDEPDDGYIVYSVTPYYFDGKTKHFGKTVVLPPVTFSGGSSPQRDAPNITKKDWTTE